MLGELIYGLFMVIGIIIVFPIILIVYIIITVIYLIYCPIDWLIRKFTR